ncbi:MAG: tetratricopeptide repeat protein [Thermoplasmata archaeon]
MVRESSGSLLESIFPRKRLLHLTLLWLYLLGQLLLFSAFFTSLESSVFPLTGLLIPVSAASAGAVSIQRRLAGEAGPSIRLQELWMFIHGAITAILGLTIFIALGAPGEGGLVAVTLIVIMLLFSAATLHSGYFDARAAFLTPLTLGLSWPLLIVLQMSFNALLRPSPWVFDTLVFSLAAAVLLAMLALIYIKSKRPVPGRYSAVWAGALTMAAIAPLHELLGFWSNKMYGEVDRTLALTGFLIAGASLLHFAFRSHFAISVGAAIGASSRTHPEGRACGICVTPRPNANREETLQAVALNEEGLACMRRGEHGRALERFERALELDPRLEPIWTNRGTALLRAGSVPDAIRSYNRALQLNDAYLAAWINEGHALIDSGDPEGALKCLERALALNPSSELAWSERGVALRRLGRSREAEESFGRALTLNPGLAIAWNNRGNALMDRGILEEAFHCYNIATIIDPTYDIAWYNKACALLKSGRAQEALRCFERSITASLERVIGAVSSPSPPGIEGLSRFYSPGAVAL